MKLLALFAPLILVGVYAIIMNLVHLNSGMLEPNFEIINQFYRFNFFLLPSCFIFLCLFYLVLFFRSFKKARTLFLSAFCGFVAFSLLALDYYITEVEPYRCHIREVQLFTDKISKPLKIVHFSDIQSAGVGEYEALVFEKITSINPDLILYTGDFLQLGKDREFNKEWSKLLVLFKQLNPRFGIYAVFGDTELELYSRSKAELMPIRMLSSTTSQFEFEGGTVSILGLSLFQSKRPLWAMRSIEPWIESSDEELFKIALGHSPNFALALKDTPVDLCLAGHTHGGQVRVPFYGPLTIYSKIPKEWALGFRQIGLPYLNVTAGVGSNRYGGLPPIRFNCPTELTVIELLPK
jgi:predicted MPP superfamily phosphohydrolase